MRAGAHRAAIAVTVLCAAACSNAPPSASASPSRPPAQPIATPAATSPAPATSLAACGAPVSLPQLPHVQVPVTDPDDIAPASGGGFWLSDRTGGHLLRLDAAGAVTASVLDSAGPEGIVVLTDGTLLVAQQIPDRIDHFVPSTGVFTPWLQLQPRAGVDGLDGIGIVGGVVLVPDSARGDVLAVRVEGNDVAGTPSVVASGLGRPVDAVTDGGMGEYIALENTPGLVHVSATGLPAPIGDHASLDDLIGVHGLLYATDLADHSVLAIDPATGASRTLVTDVDAPQGIAAAADGRLVVTDSTTRTLAWFSPCG